MIKSRGNSILNSLAIMNPIRVDESLCSHLVEAEAETYPLFLSIYIN